MIQASHATAELLMSSGKSHWLTAREDSVMAKGKGVLSTFWIMPKNGRKGSSRASSTGDASESSASHGRRLSFYSDAGSAFGSNSEKKKHNRLVEWVTEIISGHVKKVMAKRGANPPNTTVDPYSPTKGGTFLDEVAEVIILPKFDSQAALSQANHTEIDLSFEIVAELREYVGIIAGTYNDNSFHKYVHCSLLFHSEVSRTFHLSFEHACHVTMAVDKFLKRIVAPDLDLEQMATTKEAQGALASHLHDYTHGINSDPMTLLAIVFSALIHDVDHKVSFPSIILGTGDLIRFLKYRV